MRLRNETITLGLKRKPINPVLYERIDENNVRIGTKWFKRTINLNITGGNIFKNDGVTIYHGKIKQFIANSWYSDINTDEL